MLSRRRFATFACLMTAWLLTTSGCSEPTDTTESSQNPAATETPAADVSQAPQTDSGASSGSGASEESAAAGRSDEPSKEAFLAAAEKGVKVTAGASAETPDEPPFVSTPDNPDPVNPFSAEAGTPAAEVDPAWREKWETSFEKAKATAQAEQKDILMNFTGSDWCGWCIRLGQEVFQHKEFADYARKNFVLLELDFPRGFELDESLQQQNEALQAQFSVQGFPSILLTDGLGRAYAQTGYQPGGPGGYIEHLESLKEFRRTRDAAFAAAESLAGSEKARKLDEGLEAIQPSLRFASYSETIDRIIELDADDSAGLRKKYEASRAEHQFSRKMQAVVSMANSTKDWDAVLAGLDKLAAEYAAFDDLAVQAQMLRLQVLRIAERTDDAITAADQLLAGERLEEQSRLQVHVSKLAVLDQANRLEEALPVIDAILSDFGDQKELRVNLLMTRAGFLGRLGRKDAAKAVIQTVRETVEPSMLPQVDAFEKEILAEPQKPAAEASPEATPRKPEAGNPAADKPAAEAAPAPPGR